MIIYNIDKLDKRKLNIVRKKSKKTQIFLFDTERRIDDYINKTYFYIIKLILIKNFIDYVQIINYFLKYKKSE